MTGQDVFRIDLDSGPYMHLDFKNDPDEFHFAVLSDNAGSRRAGVRAAGPKRVNLFRPECVVGLGDLVEGYVTPDGYTAIEDTYREWRAEVDDELESLDVPFFLLQGNHDINSPPSVNVWRERLGGTREYEPFRYKDTLSLMVSTQDPPKDTDALREHDPARAELIDHAYAGRGRDRSPCPLGRDPRAPHADRDLLREDQHE